MSPRAAPPGHAASAPARPPMVELVERLEAMWSDPESTDIVELSAIVEERQGLLTQIQNSDASTLDPAVREALARRVAAVRTRDEQLLAVVRGRCDKILEALEAVVVARTAARGYRAADEDAGPQLERIA